MVEIYSAGDAEFLTAIFNMLAMLRNSGGLATIGVIGFIVGLLVMGFRSMLTAGRDLGIHQFFTGYILFMMLFGPTTTVVIQQLTPTPLQPAGATYVRDNVPFGIAAIVSAFSQVGYGGTRMMEQALSVPQRASVSESGFGRALEHLAFLRLLDGKALAKDAGLSAYAMTLAHYIESCTIPGLDGGLVDAPSMFTNIKPLEGIALRSQWHTTLVYLDAEGAPLPTSDRTEVTCSDATARLSAGQGTTMVDGANRVLAPAFNMEKSIDAGQETPLDAAAESFAAFGGKQIAMQDYVMAGLVRSVFDASKAGSVQNMHSTAASVMIANASSQRQVQWSAEEDMFRRIMRPMTAFFEALPIALAPFIAFILGLGQPGISLALKYAVLGLWVQLWPMLLAIQNLFMVYGVERYFELIASDPATASMTSVANAVAVTEQAMDWVSTAGYLAAATPILALTLLTGSMYAMTNAAQRVTGADHVKEQIMSPDAVQPSAALSVGPGLQTDRALGSIMGGSAPAQVTYSTSSALEASTASSRELAETRARQLTRGVQEAVRESGGLTESGREALTTAWRESTESNRNALRRAAATLGVDENALASAGYSRSQTDQMVLSAALSGNLGRSLGRGKGESGAAVGGSVSGNAKASTIDSTTYNTGLSNALTEKQAFALSTDGAVQAALGKILASDASVNGDRSAAYQLGGERAATQAEQTNESWTQSERFQEVASDRDAVQVGAAKAEGYWAMDAIRGGQDGRIKERAQRLDQAAFTTNYNELEAVFPNAQQRAVAASLRTLAGYNASNDDAAMTANKQAAFAQSLLEVSGSGAAGAIRDDLADGGAGRFNNVASNAPAPGAAGTVGALRGPEGSAGDLIDGAKRKAAEVREKAKQDAAEIPAQYQRNLQTVNEAKTDQRNWFEANKTKAESNHLNDQTNLNRIAEEANLVRAYGKNLAEVFNSFATPAVQTISGALDGQSAADDARDRAAALGATGDTQTILAYASHGALVHGANVAGANTMAADEFAAAVERSAERLGPGGYATVDRLVGLVRSGEADQSNPEFMQIVGHLEHLQRGGAQAPRGVVPDL